MAIAVFSPINGLLAAELVLPQNRNAFYAGETIEFAVAGLGKGQAAMIDLAADKANLAPVTIPVVGDGGTVTVSLPGNSLSPAGYDVKLDGKDAAKLTVSTGVSESPLFVSQMGNLSEAGANFIVGNAFGFGLLDKNGQPELELRGKRSPGLNAFEKAVAANLPTLVYMYWTGFVTHKPWGREMSWGAAGETESMRLFNFRTAQVLRRYAANILSVGTLDEPGMSAGKTPAGGLASGFPSWDEKSWYSARGWNYTDDPGNRPDDDWMKYMAIRCSIIKEQDAQACQDLKTVWPSLVFATDLFAPQAIMDGADPMNQEINDIPTTHVFVDWGIGRLGALSGLCLEKCFDPTCKVAHAMNGQLFGATVPQPNQSDSYRVVMNALLMAGLHSNWWLNMRGMKPADLKAINEPAARLGPLFVGAEPAGHDIALLWSFTECAMREKEMSVREAKNKTGEQIKLMVASLPEDAGAKDGQVEANPYSVAENYKDNILLAHEAIIRAGYPADILHERRVAQGWLKNYKVLVVVGQTFVLPADVRAAIADFQKAGGVVVVDKSTRIKFDGALVTDAALKDLGWRWQSVFLRASKPNNGLTPKESSLDCSNYFMDEPARVAAPLLKATLAQTPALPAIVTDSVQLAAERQTAGEGQLILVLNACEKLPEIADTASYWLYNYAPLQASFTLQGVPSGAVVYCLEGTDWSRVSKVASPQAPLAGDFAAGEMKIYLVAPHDPAGLDLTADYNKGALAVHASLEGLKMPWPFTLTVTAPDGSVRYNCFRGTDKTGVYDETLPLGINTPTGDYLVHLESPIAGLKADAKVTVAAATPSAALIADTVRVFDDGAIRAFLAVKPALVVAYGNDGQKAFAVKLASDLAAKGFKAEAEPDRAVLSKVDYPRLWNPTAQLCSPTGDAKPNTDPVKNQIRLGVDAHGNLTSQTADGKEIFWRTPQSEITIIGDGFVDYEDNVETCYEPGVKLYVDAKRQVTALKGETKVVDTTPAFRAKWARPWTRLSQYIGGCGLPPELPEAYTTDSHLILLGDSKSGTAVAALQASEILPQVADETYPGPGKALLEFAWSPFAVGKNVVFIGAADDAGLKAAAGELLQRAAKF